MRKIICDQKYILVVGLAFLIPGILGMRSLLGSVALSLLVTLVGIGLLVALVNLGNRKSPWAMPTWIVLVLYVALTVQTLVW